MYERRPNISIIITADNDGEMLKQCIKSFYFFKNEIKNIEFIILNNFVSNFNSEKVEQIINKYNDINLVFYQHPYRVNKAQLKNLGIDFSKGMWLFFMDYTEFLIPKFINFLDKFKFDLQTHFYRVPLLQENKKKRRIGLFKTKYFSNQSSSLILNSEFLERIKLRWESSISFDDTILFMNKIYSIKNVNFTYLKKQLSVMHNFKADLLDNNLIDYDEMIKTYKKLVIKKYRNYKQFIILLFFNFYSRNNKKNNKITDAQYMDLKKNLKDCKIFEFSYWPLGPKLYFKTIPMKFKLLFFKKK